MINKILKTKKGTMLIEALISIFIIGTLFISIAVAVTSSITNTKLLQEANETSAYAQKIVDSLYAISETESGLFFDEIKQTYDEYIDKGDFSVPCVVDIDGIAQEIQLQKDEGKDVISLYDILNYNDDDITNDASGEAEMRKYKVKLYILPSENADTSGSVNYFTTYNPYLTDGLNGSRIFNMKEFNDVYSFKLVVTKNVRDITVGSTDYTAKSPSSVSLFFQIRSNGVE